MSEEIIEINKEEQKKIRSYGKQSIAFILYSILKMLRIQRGLLKKIEENTRGR